MNEDAIQGAITHRASFNLIRLKRMVKVDVFVPEDSGFHASKWKRVRREIIDVVGSRPICVTSPEDIVLQKLDCYRRGGHVSMSQWRDVTALLRIQKGNLDDEYLTTWAENVELAELLSRARDDGMTG